MKNTKLYFNFIRDFNDDIELIANNHIDIENYLSENYNYTNIKSDIDGNQISFKMPNDSATYYAEIKWVQHI